LGSRDDQRATDLIGGGIGNLPQHQDTRKLNTAHDEHEDHAGDNGKFNHNAALSQRHR
jgi:hypothetical protein